MNLQLVILLLILAFPITELYLLLSWIASSPVVALLYTFFSMVVGYFCISIAKVGFREIPNYLKQHSNQGLRGALFFGKLFFIGILFMIPGYLTDIIAVLIFFFAKANPSQNNASFHYNKPFDADDSSAYSDTTNQSDDDEAKIVETTAEVVEKNDAPR